MNQMLLALLLFAAMYVLLLVFAEHRWIIALSAALVFVLAGILPVSAAWRQCSTSISYAK